MKIEEAIERLDELATEGNGNAVAYKALIERADGAIRERMLENLVGIFTMIDMFESNIDKPEFREGLINALGQR